MVKLQHHSFRTVIRTVISRVIAIHSIPFLLLNEHNDGNGDNTLVEKYIFALRDGTTTNHILLPPRTMTGAPFRSCYVIATWMTD